MRATAGRHACDSRTRRVRWSESTRVAAGRDACVGRTARVVQAGVFPCLLPWQETMIWILRKSVSSTSKSNLISPPFQLDFKKNLVESFTLSIRIQMCDIQLVQVKDRVAFTLHFTFHGLSYTAVATHLYTTLSGETFHYPSFHGGISFTFCVKAPVC